MNLQRAGLLVALCTLVAAVYLLTYSGRIESGDTLSLFDAASSLVHYGDSLFDQSASVNFPPARADDRLYPLAGADVEPLHGWLAAGLIALAERLPGIGLVHAAWLLNVLVSAAAVGTLYIYARALGYHAPAAVLAALALGLATAVWPYSKTFFREPLALWLILLAALLLDRWRAHGYRSLPLLVGSLLALAAAYLSKEAVVFALPALALVVMPGWERPPRALALSFKLGMALILLALAVLIALTLISGSVSLTRLYDYIAWILRRRTTEVVVAVTALHSYLLSIGGSVWGTSPVVLLALPGMWRLYRRGQYRYIAVAVMLVLAFAAGYAVLRGVHWFGGLSWPPRFLLPVLPFLILAALPVFDRLTQRPFPRWLAAGAGGLIAYSVWVQLSGVTLPWGAYTAALPPESGGLSEWGGGLNVVPYLRWVVIPPLWGQMPLDFAWVRVNNLAWPLLAGGLAVVSLWQLIRLLRGQRGLPPVVLPLALVAVVYIGLRGIYDDALYLPPERDALFQAVALLEQEAAPDDVLLLSSDTYQPFFLNVSAAPRVISLPDQPGEQPSPEQPPLIRAENPDALLTKETIPLLFNLAGQRDRLWLLADSGPWLAWSVRPVERFLSMHYYPLRVIEFAPTVRLIEYDTTDAPNPYAFRGPEYPADLVYGGELRLAGFSLPKGTIYAPGETLPLSLYWVAQQPPERDYTVAWFVAGADGRITQGQDTLPGGGFQPTSRWLPGAPVWDNRALRLPVDWPPGEYQLWVRVYYWDGEARLLPVQGDGVDEMTGLLPVTIYIQ